MNNSIKNNDAFSKSIEIILLIVKFLLWVIYKILRTIYRLLKQATTYTTNKLKPHLSTLEAFLHRRASSLFGL